MNPLADSAARPKSSGRFRITSGRLIILVTVMVATILAARWAWLREKEPKPPTVALAGLDPEVVQAIDKARTEVEQSPRSAQGWGRLGMVLHAHGCPAEAGECYRQAERLDPSEPRWPYYLSVVLALSSDDEALAALERVVERAENSFARLKLAELLLERGRDGEADGHFRRVLQAQPDNPRAHLGLAQLAYRRGDFRMSRDHLTRVVAAAPRAKAAHALLAEIDHRLGDPASMEKALQAVAALPDDLAWPDPMLDEVWELEVGLTARLTRADKLVKNGRAMDAAAVLEKAARDYPDSHRPWHALGKLQMLAVQFPAAEQSLRTAVRLAPEDGDSWFDLATVLEKTGNQPAAIECLRKAVKLQPRNAKAHYALGYCLRKADDFAGAARSFRAALDCKPDFAIAHRDLGEALARQGADAEAIPCLERALHLAPTDMQTQNLLKDAQSRLPPRKP